MSGEFGMQDQYNKMKEYYRNGEVVARVTDDGIIYGDRSAVNDGDSLLENTETVPKNPEQKLYIHHSSPLDLE